MSSDKGCICCNTNAVCTSSLSTMYYNIKTRFSIFEYNKSGQIYQKLTKTFFRSCDRYEYILLRLQHDVGSENSRLSIYFIIYISFIFTCISAFIYISIYISIYFYYGDIFQKEYLLFVLYLASEKCIICLICNSHSILNWIRRMCSELLAVGNLFLSNRVYHNDYFKNAL